ncbi:MAG TPA: STM4015 family protein, partial [Burkholderiaceae bacterium]
MTISQATETFFGKPIRHWSPGDPAPADAGVAWRLAFDHDDDTSMVERLEQFLQAADPAGVTALVFGDWEDSYDAPPEAVLDLLCRRAADLPALRALFVGDMTYEECEISWIKQADYTWVLEAFPALQVLRIRGSDGLVLPADAAHAQLRELVIECGGLPKSVLERLAGARLPALERLELWLGTDEYGFDGDLDDVRAAVDALRSPRLRELALRDAEIADEVAAWLAGEDWVAQLSVLDLSLGTLGDAGAQALLASPR